MLGHARRVPPDTSRRTAISLTLIPVTSTGMRRSNKRRRETRISTGLIIGTLLPEWVG
ncbi:hypothetical protein GOB13_30765 [Sinorhizobium meliloti]|nr:hypothetical protein [Sinorhizobium meliloti]MDX0067232.1 hypothetical protein [Sinorhizobium meliloti]MDX0085592.1 hypothetical protein [Sinorhizobium meliloti]MDX0228880.1 hypothetical protein [Sinorhizobium meliloti]MQU72983.1 hypothetical protein [Sinorhizobium meliloti]